MWEEGGSVSVFWRVRKKLEEVRRERERKKKENSWESDRKGGRFGLRMGGNS